MNYPVGVSTKISSAGIEPVSLALAKQQLRIDDDLTHDDAFVSSLITSARSVAETHLKKPLIDHVIETRFTEFGNELPLIWRTETIDSVVYVEILEDDTTQEVTMDPALYYIGGPNRDLLKFTAPEDLPDDVRTITVTYQTPQAGELEPDIISSMLLVITDLYENRVNPSRRYLTASEQFLNRHRTPSL